MANPYLTLENVSYVLPNGRVLFSALNEQLDQRATGIVGRNGIGKTMLMRILAGHIQPTTGHYVQAGSVYYLEQQISHQTEASIASLAGVQHILDAIKRIEAGSFATEDFDMIADRWDIQLQLAQALERNGLGYLDLETPANLLSGGEAMRVSLIGAFLSEADFLILDEPSNHLDRIHCQALIEQLASWSKGLIITSHDRQLLDQMNRIIELSSLGLRSYGGNYSFYAQHKEQERRNAVQQLEHLKLERQKQQQSLREQQERMERRQARGNRHGKEANQAKILLDRQKERSESSTGKFKKQQQAAKEQMSQQIREAAQKIEENLAIVVHELPVSLSTQQRVAQLDAVELPFVQSSTRYIDLMLSGSQRLAVIGPNGCGKSTLLKVLAQQISPLSGSCKIYVKSIYLDQKLSNLDQERTVLEQLLEVNPTASESGLRMRLAQLGLDAQKITVTSGLLSGGERLKAALACVLYADPPMPLLLLDEPSNHLDLPSIQALESMLAHYHGTLVVVSHDDLFLDNLDLTHRLIAMDQGWQLQPW